MKVSDYIVEYLIKQGVSDVFGYPGGMVTHLMDSFLKYKDRIRAHVMYHEQGAAFAACGYAQATKKLGVAYATSGPGATNLVTGICNAFFDSLPVLFITGQVNTGEAKGTFKLRQRGFQETDIVDMVKGVTKYCAYVDDASQIKEYLERAIRAAMDGRRGPVLLDVPMDILRAEIELELEPLSFIVESSTEETKEKFLFALERELKNAKRPCILVGNGIKSLNQKRNIRNISKKLKIPVISSMIAMDIMSREEPWYYGFIGAYGDRTANFLAAKCDLLICLGSRLDVRQVGAVRKNFAPNARIFRIDIDQGELEYSIRKQDSSFQMDLRDALKAMSSLNVSNDYTDWLEVCSEIKKVLAQYQSNQEPEIYIRQISKMVPDGSIITTDVGQNQVWLAQFFQVKENQEFLFSGGHGAMGYSLPAAIGAYYGTGKPVYCFCGDGGMQMNIQELQCVANGKLPIKIFVLNNSALGMIRHFQEMYFQGRYMQTIPEGGYVAPDFCAIAKAYGISEVSVREPGDLKKLDFTDDLPELIEIQLSKETYVYPKLEFGKPNQDQEPLLDREVYDYLMGL